MQFLKKKMDNTNIGTSFWRNMVSLNMLGKLFKKVLTPEAEFGFANSRVDLVLWYLRNFGLDGEIIKHNS